MISYVFVLLFLILNFSLSLSKMTESNPAWTIPILVNLLLIVVFRFLFWSKNPKTSGNNGKLIITLITVLGISAYFIIDKIIQ